MKRIFLASILSLFFGSPFTFAKSDPTTAVGIVILEGTTPKDYKLKVEFSNSLPATKRSNSMILFDDQGELARVKLGAPDKKHLACDSDGPSIDRIQFPLVISKSKLKRELKVRSKELNIAAFAVPENEILEGLKPKEQIKIPKMGQGNADFFGVKPNEPRDTFEFEGRLLPNGKAVARIWKSVGFNCTNCSKDTKSSYQLETANMPYTIEKSYIIDSLLTLCGP